MMTIALARGLVAIADGSVRGPRVAPAHARRRSGFLHRIIAAVQRMNEDERNRQSLADHVARLAALSPHLLDDIGLDASGKIPGDLAGNSPPSRLGASGLQGKVRGIAGSRDPISPGPMPAVGIV